MREIKFRAWVKNKKAGHEMFTVVMISWIGKEVILSGRGGSVGLEDCELMQYIGLKDKNGKEIYEGDMLATSNIDAKYDIWDKSEIGYAQVYWSPDYNGWRSTPWDFVNNGDESIYCLEFCEVIGNIYEVGCQ